MPSLPIFLTALCALAPARAEWNKLPVSQPESTLCVADLPGRLLAGTARGLMASTDGGVTWAGFGKGLRVLPVSGLIEAEAGLISVQADSIYLSADQGATWMSVGESGGDTFWSLGKIGDTLSALWSGFPPHLREISLDGGRTWKTAAQPVWNEADITDSTDAGVRFFVHNGAVLRSLDKGATWVPCGLNDALGPVAGFASRAEAFAATRSGNLVRSRDSGSTWEVVAVGSRPATPVAIAAEGKDVCFASGYGVSCSRDYGANFRHLFANPWDAARMSLSLGGGRLYLSTVTGPADKKAISLDLNTGAGWRLIPFQGKVGETSQLGARDSTVLIIRTHADSILISFDQGRTFKSAKSSYFYGLIGQPLLGRKFWAYAINTQFLLSTNQGATWFRSRYYSVPSLVTGSAVSDSDAFIVTESGSLVRHQMRDSTWATVAMPDGVKARSVAAADTILYAGVDGFLLRQDLYGTAVGLRRPKPAGYPASRRKAPALASPGRTPPPPWVDTRGRLKR